MNWVVLTLPALKLNGMGWESQQKEFLSRSWDKYSRQCIRWGIKKGFEPLLSTWAYKGDWALLSVFFFTVRKINNKNMIKAKRLAQAQESLRAKDHPQMMHLAKRQTAQNKQFSCSQIPLETHTEDKEVRVVSWGPYSSFTEFLTQKLPLESSGRRYWAVSSRRWRRVITQAINQQCGADDIIMEIWCHLNPAHWFFCLFFFPFLLMNLFSHLFPSLSSHCCCCYMALYFQTYRLSLNAMIKWWQSGPAWGPLLRTSTLRCHITPAIP